MFSRWLRLLFGRELAFDQLLRLWDLLIVESDAKEDALSCIDQLNTNMQVVDCVFVAMLMQIRHFCKGVKVGY